MVDINIRALVMFLTGGIVYFYFEILMRGYSHLSMFLLGGVCFFIVGKWGNHILEIKTSLIYKLAIIMSISAIVITSLEFITGMIVNVYMNLSVWDYSHMKYNYMGQICVLYSVIWSLLGLPCVFLYGIINRFVLECSART